MYSYFDEHGLQKTTEPCKVEIEGLRKWQTEESFHLTLSERMSKFASIAVPLGKLAKNKRAFQRLEMIRGSRLRQAHLLLATALFDIALAKFELELFDSCMSLCTECSQVWELYLGSSSLQIMRVMKLQARIAERMGNIKGCEIPYVRNVFSCKSYRLTTASMNLPIRSYNSACPICYSSTDPSGSSRIAH